MTKRFKIRLALIAEILFLLYSPVSTHATVNHKIFTALATYRYQEAKGQASSKQNPSLLNAIDREDLQTVKVLLAEEKREGRVLNPYLEKINKIGDRFYDRNRFKDALDWYRLAADEGYEVAQASVGYMYLNGRGVTKSDEEALKWFKQAADKGSAWGYANLGFMYEKGRGGLVRSQIEAVRLYKLAAKMDNAFAQEQLNRLGVSGELPVVTAVELGEIEEVRKLLKSSPNAINVQDKKGKSLLLIATLKGNRELVSLLISLGANPNLQDEDGEFPLLAAITMKHADIVEEIMKAHPNVNLANRDGDIPLTQAFVKRMRELVPTLIKAGADVNKPGRGGGTALHWAVPESDVPEAAQYLRLMLDAGAAVNAREEHGFTPLMLSVDSPQLLATTALLIEKGADVNNKDILGNTSLMAAALGGFLPQVELLLKNKARIDDVNQMGVTALMLATQSEHKDIVRLLLEKGAKVELKDKMGRTAVTIAASTGDAEVVQEFINLRPDITELVNKEKQNAQLFDALIKKDNEQLKKLLALGTDVNAVDSEGRTPLIIGILSQNVEAVRLLIAAKAKLDYQAEGKPTILMLAAGLGQTEVVNLLLQAGAQVNAKDVEGRTALLYAVALPNGVRSPDVLTALVKAGADVNASDKSNLSALQAACIQRWWTATQQLIRAGAKDEDGSCLLLSASAVGTKDEVLSLLKSGINVNVQNKTSKITPLHAAVDARRVDIAEILLQAGADSSLEDLKGATALTQAIMANRLDLIKVLLRFKANLKQTVKDDLLARGGTPLHLAVSEHNAEIVQELINAGADVNARDDEGRTPLMLTSDASIFRALIKAGANINLIDNDGWSALMHALQRTDFSENRDLSTIKILIQSGVDVNLHDKRGQTPLIIALQNPSSGVPEMVRLLLDARANLNDEIGASALIIANDKEREGRYKGVVSLILSHKPRFSREQWHDLLVQAASSGNTELVKAAIAAGADARVRDDNGQSLLMLGAGNNVETIQALLNAKVDVNLKNNEGTTALMNAADSWCVECVKLLIKAGADLNAQDNEGNTALTIAVNDTYREADVVKTLLEAGAKWDIANNDGDNALLIASSVGAAEAAEALLKTGASVEIKDREGRTPLIRSVLARSGRYPAPDMGAEVINKLITAGANINAVDNEGASALITAARKGYVDLVRLLLKAGAKVDVRTQSGTNALAEVLNARDEEIESLDPIARLTPEAQVEVAEELIKGGIDVNSKSEDGSTPLMLSSFRNQVNLVGLLIKSGADVNAKNDQGWTALMFAAGQGNAEVVKALLDAHADVKIKDQNGSDALLLAKNNNHPDVVRLLSQASASKGK